MTSFLLNRPIAVFMVTLALLTFSILAFLKLPISLLPPIDVPSIIIKVNAPNESPQTIEENILKPIRENLLTLSHLKEIESTAWGEGGQINLRFTYKANMKLTYIEVNERIDRLQAQLPTDLERPTVARLSTSDIPIMRIQVVPKNPDQYVEVSQLANNVLKRRVEQLKGVSLVDVIGDKRMEITVVPLFKKLEAYNISLASLINTINVSNIQWGSISVKDGQYRYYIKVASLLTSAEDILLLPIRTKEGQIIRVKDVAQVQEQVQVPTSAHYYNNQEGLAIIIHKQGTARMLELTSRIENAVKVFKDDYPEAKFIITQDQSALLKAGISNLRMALLLGGVFAFFVLLLFMSNIRLAVIMGVSLPVSLVVSFLLLYIFNITINIISLSGLALGLGMLIDNAIIVLDNIRAKHKAGNTLETSCAMGVKEVQAPLLSSVLTTLAIFVPLIFLNGMAGALVYDQAIAVSAILGVSLLVAFTLLPLLYKLLFQQTAMSKNENKLFAFVTLVYEKLFTKSWKYKKATLILISMFCALGIWLGSTLSRSVLPPIKRSELILKIVWNEPIGLKENIARVKLIHSYMEEFIDFAETEVGEIGGLTTTGEYGSDNVLVYIKFKKGIKQNELKNTLNKYLKSRFPLASTHFESAPNAFDQLFRNDKSFLIIKLRENNGLLTQHQASLLLDSNFLNTTTYDKGFTQETSIKLTINNELLALYKVDREELYLQLRRIFGKTKITTLKSFGDNTTVLLKDQHGANQNLNQLYITSATGVSYPISTFINLNYVENYKYITADRKGVYQAALLKEEQNVPAYMAAVKKKAIKQGILIDFDGTYFESNENLNQLIGILLISFGLLYFILAAQFESFLQPIIIIITLPLGIGGSLFLLYLTNSSLNIMSAIGVIVMLGIMINDSILKVDTINRNVRTSNLNNLSENELFELIRQAGLVRLRPILMTSLTTILALLPILIASGLGADLQRGLVLAVIGGLTVGTITSLFFVPHLYYYFVRFGSVKRKLET